MRLINSNNENKIVGQIAEIIALRYGVHSSKAKQIRIAATLHDIGKKKIPDSILSKPGKLNKHEFETIKSHTLLGAELLVNVQGELGEMARACCLYHHEWFDGGGYWGRRFDDLPYYLPFVSIADVYTALISKRPYKHAWIPAEAMQYIKSKSGSQFSPELVEVFASLVRNDSRISALFTDIDTEQIHEIRRENNTIYRHGRLETKSLKSRNNALQQPA